MTVDQMVSYLRHNVSIQDPEGVVQDSAYLSMTDEDIILYMNVALTRNFPSVPSLDYLPAEYVYPVILLSKKELYFSLASKEAPLFDIGADNNNYLKRDQRFQHYMKLVKQAEDEYKDYMENGGAGANTLTSFDVLLSNRYATTRNYEKGAVPALALYIGLITDNSVEISWAVKMSRFQEYRVYVSEFPIVDLCDIHNHIAEGAKKVAVIKDVHQTACRIEGLTSGTTYYVAVAAVEKSSLIGYGQESFTTVTPVVVKVGEDNG